MVSRSHKGEVYKLVEKFDPPGIVTPAGGAGYKVGGVLEEQGKVQSRRNILQVILVPFVALGSGGRARRYLPSLLADQEGNQLHVQACVNYLHVPVGPVCWSSHPQLSGWSADGHRGPGCQL